MDEAEMQRAIGVAIDFGLRSYCETCKNHHVLDRKEAEQALRGKRWRCCGSQMAFQLSNGRVVAEVAPKEGWSSGPRPVSGDVRVKEGSLGWGAIGFF